MVRLALRTGLRWKLSAAIALVGALVAIALSLVVHNAARGSMLDNSRDVQTERLNFTQKIYESTHQLRFGAKLDDPALPKELRDEVTKGKRATYLEDTGQTTPKVWAAAPVAGGRVLSIQGYFPTGSPSSTTSTRRC
ncbi:sensor protein CseC [Streptomyces chrestomyceticus JCM 4735]|uniref:Sensor protein CseC n=1 Tax=Streptomyces chrestomyceticus JCM 4735 TaxID=1306181 RepID=A0A7U9KUY7_9ACTN|nr:sensor protein CseC [Streptomyces chrestomyceticus JCM 4735]